MRGFAAVVLLIAAAFGSYAQSDTAAKDKILALDRQFISFFEKGDADGLGPWLDAHLTDNFSCIAASGRLYDKQQFRASRVANAKSGTSRTEVSEEHVNLFDDTAIITRTEHSVARLSSGQSREATLRIMTVWVRQNGDWKTFGCSGAYITPPKITSGAQN